MEIENTLARNISTAGEKAAYDAACKQLLANKSILSWIMKSCMEEYRDISVEEIEEKYIEGAPQIAGIAVNPNETIGEDGRKIRGANTEDSTMNEGVVTYDIRFYATAPRTGESLGLIINVEAQKDFYPGYPIVKRSLYYCSRMISSQYGMEFADMQYAKIKKVYSIWICANPPKNRENTIVRYAVQEESLVGVVKEKREHYDLLTAVIICLGHSGVDNDTGILKLLNVLLFSEKKPEEKKKILQEDFDIKMTKELESEVVRVCNLSEGVEERGIRKGMQTGMQTGILMSIRNLMETMGWSAEQAMKALKVSETEQPLYTGMLEK